MMRIRRQAFVPVAVLCVLIGVLALAAGSAFADAPPAVTIDAPTNVSYTTAHVSGTVNPEGGPSATTWHFEYSSEPSNEFAWSYAFLASGEISGTEAEGTTPITVEGNLESLGELPGLTPGAEYSVRLVAENELGANRVVTQEPYPTLKTKPVPLPSVSFAAPSAVTGTSAHFSGEINPHAPAGNPQAFEVNWRFECTPECPALEGSIPANNINNTVEANATGLLYNTSYEVKLIATNAGGKATQAQTFKTEAVAPEVESRPAGDFTATTALVGGSVDPNGSATTYTIEYANNPTFTNPLSVPATENASAGSGQTPTIVSQLISGLEPNSTYYFRITAKNQVTTVVSAPQSFVTRAAEESSHSCPNEQLRSENNSTALPDCRAYELVSPDADHAQVRARRGRSGERRRRYDVVSDPRRAAERQIGAAAPDNQVRATRNPVTGWRGESLTAALPEPGRWVLQFSNNCRLLGSLSTFSETDQPLSGGQLTNGKNDFIGHPDGTYTLITRVTSPGFGPSARVTRTSAMFTSIRACSSCPRIQLVGQSLLVTKTGPEARRDPSKRDLRAASGVNLVGNIIGSISADANRALFTTEGKLICTSKMRRRSK